MHYRYTTDIMCSLFILDHLRLLSMLLYFIHFHYLSHYSLLVLRYSMFLYLLHYMFHFTDYHLPLRILCMFLVLLTSSYMSGLSLMLSHLYNSLMYTIDNLMFLIHLFTLLYMLSLGSHLLVRYYLYLHLLVLCFSMFLLCLHSHFLIHSHLLPSSLLYMFMVHPLYMSMLHSFMLTFMYSLMHFIHNYFMNILHMLSFLLMYRFH